MFLIDWISFTSKIDSPESIMAFLQLENIEFQFTNGFYGYRDSYYFNGIRIHFNPRSEDMGILIEISGTGFRAYETYGEGNFSRIFKLIVDNQPDYNITRLDVAFDDKEDEIIPIRKLGSDTENKNFVSRWTEWSVRNSSKGYTVELGSQESDVFFRIYDKASERGLDSDSLHWIRLELQLRRERAFEFIKLFNDNIGELWCGVVNNYIRYVKPSPTDDNKSRWSLRPYWRNLINNALKIKLFVAPGEDYNMDNLDNYVFKQAVGAIKTSVQILGKDKFLAQLDDTRINLNPKYKRLISEHTTKESIKK